MALIRCNECDREVSTRAEKCPHCGYPMQRTTHKADYQDPFMDDYVFDDDPYDTPPPKRQPHRHDRNADSKRSRG